MSVPDSAILPNVIQQAQTDKTTNPISSGSVSSILVNSSGSTNFNFLERASDIKLMASSAPLIPAMTSNFVQNTNFPSGNAPRKTKASGKPATVLASPQPSQMRYLVGSSSTTTQSSQLNLARPPGIAMVSSTTPFVSTLMAPGAPTANQPRQALVFRPTVPSSTSCISPSQGTYISLSSTKPGLSACKEESIWQSISVNSSGNVSGKPNMPTNNASTPPVTKVIPIRPGPSILLPNTGNVSMIRSLLPVGTHQNHVGLPNSPSCPGAASVVRQTTPQIVSYSPLRAPPVLLMDPRLPSSNGTHNNMTTNGAQQNHMVTLTNFSGAISSQPSLTTPASSSSNIPLKLCPKPAPGVKEKISVSNQKKREPGVGRPRKPGLPKGKAQVLTASVVPSLSPPKGSDVQVNGNAPSVHNTTQVGSVKRPPDADSSTTPAPVKKKARKKLLPESGSAMVAAVVTSAAALPVTPAQMPEVPPAPRSSGHVTTDDEVPDLICHDVLVAPSPPMHVPNSAKSPATENGAFRKKTRLIFDSGAKKFQQINHEGVPDAAVVQDAGSLDFEKPVQDGPILSDPNPDPVTVKKQRRPRKPREKPLVPRTPKSPKKAKPPVIITKRTIPVALTLKHVESPEQRNTRLLRLARKWASLPEDNIQWLLATKSVNQLKIIRWLRLVDRAFLQAESAKNFEKMERLRDSKIHAVMDLEKLQAPFEPRLMHFLHPGDLEKKNQLVRKFCAGDDLSNTDIKWLKEHYDRLCGVEKTLPGLGAATDNMMKGSVGVNLSTQPMIALDLGNERGNFQPVASPVVPIQSATICLPSVSGTTANSAEKPSTSQDGYVNNLQPLSFATVQSAHQFVRKFPDSTRSFVEVKPDGIPCAVVLLFQLPNSKAVHIKKQLREPEGGFASRDAAFNAAAMLLDHLVVKYLCLPAYPVHVRYPLAPGCLNDHFPVTSSPPPNTSRWNFNKEIHGWETVQYIDATDLGSGSLGQETVQDQDFDLANDRLSASSSSAQQPSLIQKYHQVFPLCLSETDKPYQKLEKQINSRRNINLTVMANDPIGQRRWLSWDCRHLSQQYFELDTSQQLCEKWTVDTLEKMKNLKLPEKCMARASRLLELTKDGIKKPKSSVAVVMKTIKLGQQVKDVLDSYKKERPMTRRKRAAAAAAAAAAAENELLER